MLRYCPENAAAECSVRELCALTMRTGDLDRGAYRSAFFRMREGTELHRQLQQAMSDTFQPEVPFSHTEVWEDMTYTVSGRADGVGERDGIFTVWEIKSLSGNAFFMAPPEIFWAQLKCYAHFLSQEKNLFSVEARLTFIQAESHKLRHFDRTLSRWELESFYHDLLKRAAPWAKLAQERRTVTPAAIQSTRFPFTALRQGQEELMQSCYRAIRTGRRLFAQAPTGIGKTISTLYPAVRSLGNGRTDKIFYLTAKASTATEAFRAVKRIYEAGAPLRVVNISAKEQVCLCPGYTQEHRRLSDVCNAIDCPLAAGYYDRVDGALRDILSAAHGFSRGLIREVAKRHSVCPYELSLELSELCEVVICDYNYVFDPAVKLRRYFGPEAPSDQRYVFLIDEAHNLPDRTRDIYSATLFCDELEALYRDSPFVQTSLNETLERLILTLRRAKELCRDTLHTEPDGTESGCYLSREPIDGIAERAFACQQALEEWLWENREHPMASRVQDVRDRLKDYGSIAGLYDQRFYTYYQIEGGHISVKLYCIDPSALLDQCMSRAVSTVLFSATLTPTDYFADVLGGGKNALQLSLPSPFDPERLCLAAVDSISTRFDDREKSYRKIVSCIAATISGKVGNYIVYFPSYAYMEGVRLVFGRKYPGVPLIVQGRQMTLRQREEFLAQFTDDDTRLRVGFCVLGGSFSEGVDLPGKRLIGTVIVGVGLPGLSNERNILREYFDGRCDRGYDYAYTYPGMNRILQAAGRVIRRESDRGVVVLIDDRYATPAYQSLFPAAWQHIKYTGNATSLAELVKRFWKSRETTD